MKSFCRHFFTWYNQHHHHVGIGLMTPDQVHYGQADQIYAARQSTLNQTFQANPERFVNKIPEPPQKPTAVRISPPISKPVMQSLVYQAGCPIRVDMFRAASMPGAGDFAADV